MQGSDANDINIGAIKKQNSAIKAKKTQSGPESAKMQGSDANDINIGAKKKQDSAIKAKKDAIRSRKRKKARVRRK